MLNRGAVVGFIGAASVAVAAAVAGCATSAVFRESEIAKANTQTVLAFEETVFNKHQVAEGFARYVGSTYRQHDPLFPGGKEDTVKALTHLLTAVFPNSRVVVKRTVAQDDLVAVQAFWDRQPDQSRGVALIDLYRLENAKIVEHWDVVQDVARDAANGNTMF